MIVESLSKAEETIKSWLDGITGLESIQPGDNPVLNKKHLLFQLINMTDDDFGCESYEYDQATDSLMQCGTVEYMATYQVDALYCNDGGDTVIAIMREFKTGLHRRIADPENLAFRSNSVARQVSFERNNRRQYKHTVDLTFSFSCKTCHPIERIETVVLDPCADMLPGALIDQLQITKP